jgi:hypothetical protein
MQNQQVKTKEVMCLEIPVKIPHPLQRKVRGAGLTLWQLRRMLGGSPCEGELSMRLSGHKPMTPELEARIEHVLEEMKKPFITVKE